MNKREAAETGAEKDWGMLEWSYGRVRQRERGWFSRQMYIMEYQGGSAYQRRKHGKGLRPGSVSRTEL